MKSGISTSWHNRKERGSVLLLRVACALALNQGRRRAQPLASVIAKYFYVAAPRSRRALVGFWQQLRGEPASARVIKDHFRTFAYTILDRIFLFAGRSDQCRLRISGHELLWEYLDRGQGCVLIGAHLGNFEAARVAALERKDIPIRIIMDEKISEKLNSVLMKLNPSLNDAIVQLGSPTALFDVKAAVDGGGVVGLLADRVTAGEDTYQQNFLGRCASFPRTPLRLTAVLGAPVFFFTALFQMDRNGQPYYDVIFVPLSAPLGPGESRCQWIEALGRRYVTVLEQYCRYAPYNWFNFYDFWPDIAPQEDMQPDTGAMMDAPPSSGVKNMSATTVDHGRPSHDS